MNENTNLLSPERLAEIRAQLDVPRARNSYVTDYGVAADVVEELLGHLDAQREQFRQALRGLVLPKVIPDKSAANSEQVYFQGRADCIRGNNTRIRRTAASLGIDLQDLL